MKSRDDNRGRAVSAWLGVGLSGVGHLAAVAALAVGLAYLMTDGATLWMFATAMGQTGFEPDWSRVAIHVGLSALLWTSLVLGWVAMRRERGERLVRVRRGAVMLETLVILLPFLILTSGLAQYSLLNVANLLADLAAYQGARTAWIWHPELDSGRLQPEEGETQEDIVEFKARTAVAMVLAPSAGGNFFTGRNYPRGSGPPFRRVRTGIVASFRPTPVTGEQEWANSGSNWDYFSLPVPGAEAQHTSFADAFDSTDFPLRAARKCTMAWMGLEDDFEIVDDGGEVGVSFGYRYSLVFPWFAWIFDTEGGATGYSEVGMRNGNYLVISRRYTLPKQPEM